MSEQASKDMAERLGLAIGFHQRGQLAQAQAIYEQLLQTHPGHADALHLLGVIAYQQRQFGKAAELIGRAIAASPGNAAFYGNRGLALQELKQLDAAVADYDKAISIQPAFAAAYNNRGLARRELKQLEAAVADYSKAISLYPAYADAYNNRAAAQLALKNLDAAVADYGKAISLRPDYAEAYNNRGCAQLELKKLEAAIADFDRALALKPAYPEAYYNRGNTLRELGKPEAAIADYGKAIAVKPDYAEAYYYRGLALEQLKRLEPALADYGKAVSIKPDYAEAYFARGNVQRALGRPEAAIADYGRAISIRPDYADAFTNRGSALHELRKLEAAIADFDMAIAIKPDFAEAYWNKALASLLSGDFATGFELYEWRLKNPSLDAAPRSFAQPRWHGEEPLRDKKILLHSEQGLGDTIQFCRYVSLLAQAGAEVFLEVQRPLVGLLTTLDGISRVLAEGDPLPDFDYHCPLMSLAYALKTDLNTIPSPTAYLHADPAKAHAWRERLGTQMQLRVGVVWSGGLRPNQPLAWGERRNVRLDIFARALSGIDADFFSLQKGEPAESEIRGRKSDYWPRANFHNFAADIKDFSDTAALIENLDLVVSVDTSTAHLAAALGKPTWILNRFDTDWRWLLDRDDSPWYRSVKLYQQDESRSWEPVLRRVAGDLTQFAHEHRT